MTEYAPLNIDGRTRLIGLIGDPVAHSLSPAMHNAAFAHLGLNLAYVPLRVSEANLPAAVAGLSALDFAGANVTVPHKMAVARLVDELHDEASLLGAVNTVVVREGRLHGYNTDVEGFVRALLEVVQSIEPRDATALLLGAGGAGRAAALGIIRLGFRRLVIADKYVEAAESLAALARSLGPVTCTPMDVNDLTAERVRSALLVVNASPLGMNQSKVPAVLADNVGVDQIVYDVVYGLEATDLVHRAAEQGARTLDGLGMLVWQAAAAFELWTSVVAPVELMKRTVRRWQAQEGQ